MTSCSTRELGPRFFVSAGMSCIRVSWFPFLRFLCAGTRELFSCRALDNHREVDPVPSPAVECRMAPDCRTEESPSDGPVATKEDFALSSPEGNARTRRILRQVYDGGRGRTPDQALESDPSGPPSRGSCSFS